MFNRRMRLGKEDAAIIFDVDGSALLAIPKKKSDDFVSENIIRAAVIMAMMQDDYFLHLFEIKREEMFPGDSEN